MTKADSIKISAQQIKDIRGRLSNGEISSEDIKVLLIIIDLFIGIRSALESKSTQLSKWLRRIFGLKTEKSSQKGRKKSPESKDRSKLNKGRNGRNDFPGANKVNVPHPNCKPGNQCPECLSGKLREAEPAVDYDWQGHTPITLTIYLLQRLICNTCKTSFTAPSPVADTAHTVDDSADEKPASRCDRNAMANAVVAIFRFWFGIATYRLAKIQGSLGIGLPEGTQYKMIRQVYEAAYPVYEHLIYQAAQGSQIMADDTSIKIYDWLSGRGPPTKNGTPRKKAVTSAIISKSAEGHDIVLYLTGGNQAGSNVRKILANRKLDLPIPQYMCDGLAANKVGDITVIQLHCLDHARRRFYELASVFPKECDYVIGELKKVYKAESEAKIENLSPSDRMKYHKEHSQPVMESLGKWMYEQIETGSVEENSDLGRDIKYVLDRWTELNEFCHIEGAALSNSECERAIKSIITHRKNSLAYKTLAGAHTGDVIQSMIATCERSKVNFFKYLEWLQMNKSQVAVAPERFTPWAYAASC